MKLVVPYWRTPEEQRYGPIFVERLRSNLRRHTQAELLVLEDFRYGFPGYLRILEAFRPDLALEPGEIRVLTGLDTVFMGPSDWLWNPGPGPYLALPRWPYLRKPTDAWYSNALVAYDEAGRQALWAEAMKLKRPRGRSGSEMDVMRKVHRELGEVVLGTPETIVSYPMQGLLPTASVIYFHREPKQDTLPPDDPVRIEWEAEPDSRAGDPR